MGGDRYDCVGGRIVNPTGEVRQLGQKHRDRLLTLLVLTMFVLRHCRR
jgi:hypothetical protein